ncbi:CaiB/BaiF CoA transferase family protein [Sphingobium subterraneum]|uniref:Crotonobetainyl-CoA:carnitine CoA-transferase CaiB-like acyl-CoA transferase n=1 Tax=Sphingobium subterraneum TaxID=627688 RepID=A0A841IWH0_9SPHN|nr:CaiB/BaiF CoA-transferase family protein [Sphingobium subterraneum]MBB6122987.1 crotonobetainyl-CoA:carnitine CoA-transferase CaiB-like acyl-CoA transferase [Sphingobium subterraneum]
MAARLPLEGLTVVAVEQAVAAPFCTSRLADAGAHVIKVERAEGDLARGYDEVVNGLSSYFVWLNRGKESVVVDIASPDGRAELSRLIASADIVVQNLKPGAFDRLGFAPEDLRKQYPALIICSISGYGDTGPMADRKAYDLLVQAESGLSSVTGGPEAPARVGISIVDIATGSTAHAAILEAVIGRGATGQGADIRISMFDVMADWLAVPLLHHKGGNSPRRIGLSHPSISPYGVFETKDGRQMLISIQSDREWRTFADIFLGDATYGADRRFATNVDRVRNRRETDGIVATAFADMTKAQAEERLRAADAAFAGVNDMAALAQHPHLRRITVDTPVGPVAIPAPAPIVKGEARRYGAVPAIGGSRA